MTSKTSMMVKEACPDQFPRIKVSEGKYPAGDSNLLIFLRVLRSHVIVRVGDGWDTLAHYLDKHTLAAAPLLPTVRPSSPSPFRGSY